MENHESTANAKIRRNDLIYPELSYQIVGCVFEVYKAIGYGHREKIYQRAIAELFSRRSIKFKEQVYIPIRFQDKVMGRKFLDFLVEDKIIIELKRDFHFSKAHIDQVLDYLKASKLQLALLVNFGKEGATFKRIINQI